MRTLVVGQDGWAIAGVAVGKVPGLYAAGTTLVRLWRQWQLHVRPRRKPLLHRITSDLCP